MRAIFRFQFSVKMLSAGLTGSGGEPIARLMGDVTLMNSSPRPALSVSFTLKPVPLSESAGQQGATVDELTAGLAYSIAQNYLNRVVNGRSIGKNIFFQGGVAWNQSVMAAFQKLMGARLPYHPIMMWLGLLAQPYWLWRHWHPETKEAKAWRSQRNLKALI